MKNLIIICLHIFCGLLVTSCEKFLDEKPDRKLVTLSTIEDAQALLNNSGFLNQSPGLTEVASDDFYLTYDDWNAITDIATKNSYVWNFSNGLFEYDRNDWSLSYIAVYTANVVIDAIDKNSIGGGSAAEKDDVYGQALFFRSYAFYNLLQQFAKEYDVNTSTVDPGIPLRLDPNLNIPTTRATVRQCYEQIFSDMQEAAGLLLTTNTVGTRPTKPAAFAFLARICLTMGLYEEALQYSGEALKMNDTLIDYNDIDPFQENPFVRFGNAEVYIHLLLSRTFSPPAFKVDSILYGKYDDKDLRKSLFFADNGDDTYSYRGSYDGSYTLFGGPTTAELFLIQAESYARLGEREQALNKLNHLLIKRWEENGFSPLTAATADEALELVLEERRKELVFRGIRWADLKRLNKEPRFAKANKRILNGEEYILPPNDNRYVFPIPPDVVAMTGIEQNPL